MSETKQSKTGVLSRWLVALVLVPPTLAAIILTNKLFLLFWVALIGTVAWWEYAVNLLGRERRGLLAMSLIGFYATLSGAAFFGPDGQVAGLVTALAFGAMYMMYNLSPQGDRITVNLVGRYGLGHLYLTLGLSFIMLIKQLEHGANWLIFVALVTALNDTGAFFVGSKLKGPKLFVKVSPNKTISGFLGGCALAIIAGIASQSYMPLDFRWTHLAGLSLVLAIWGTLGDLFESCFKRAMGIKDTSTILRSHGGVWDRLDSLLFNFPPVYFFICWMTWP
ncbi:MAG: phosphatidate cytidylyltransferase [Deltaproteobacteria bacterium]|nr:phosphatidate cytidylyltransferase [Deltaproteobacteria bacterium]